MSSISHLAIILAGGKGSRMKSRTQNKTSLMFNGKPILQYGLELLTQTTDATIVVKGAFSSSVDAVINNFSSPTPIYTAIQRKRLGTGHAVLVADRLIQAQKLTPHSVLVGYGDHLMFCQPSSIKHITKLGDQQQAAIVVACARVDNPFGLGRIIINDAGHVLKIVEQKDANQEEQAINLVNTGPYYFNYQFLHQFLPKITKNPLSREYYITDLVALAVEHGLKVLNYELPFDQVGIGINTHEELQASQKLYQQLH